MTKHKSIEEMSAHELYELAKQREHEERERTRQANQARIDELREQRKQVTADYKKQMTAIEREIRDLGGRTRSSGSAPAATGGGRGDGQSQRLVELIRANGPISTADIKAKLAEMGVEAKNLNQQLAYLKRRGHIDNQGRAVYVAR